MPIYNGRFWAWQIRQAFLPEINAFARCLTDRLIPTLANLDAEANRVEQEVWDRPGHTPPTMLGQKN